MADPVPDDGAMDAADAWAETLRSEGKVELGLRTARSVRVLLLFLGLALVGLWISLTSDGIGEVVGWMAIVFFSGGAVVIVMQLRQARPGMPPALVVDEDGVRAFRGGLEVPWRGIEDVVVFSQRSNRSVQIVLEPAFAEEWYAGLGKANRALASANRRVMDGRTVASLPPTLDADPEALAAWLAQEAATRRGQAGLR